MPIHVRGDGKSRRLAKMMASFDDMKEAERQTYQLKERLLFGYAVILIVVLFAFAAVPAAWFLLGPGS